MLNIWLRSFYGVTLPACALLLFFELAARVSRETPHLLNSLNLWPSARELLSSIVVFAIVNIPLMLAERLWPGTNSRRNYLDGAKFWLIFIVVTYCWSKIAILLSGMLQSAPLIAWKIQSDRGAAVVALGILLPVFVFDLFYYWFHRAQHYFAGLWRFHRVHHSIVNLNCLNSYHHTSEEILRFPFIAIPLAFLLTVDVPQLVLLSAFVAVWGQYIHSDTRVHLGQLHSVFVDNAYHRIHHSTQGQHFNKNFAAFFSVWDKLFGTYQKPERGGLPAVGFAGVRPPRTVSDYLFMPFQQALSIDEASNPHNTALNTDARKSGARRLT